MSKPLLVTLTVEVNVDDEYSPDQHVRDILANARKLFSAAEVNVVRVEYRDPPLESVPSEPASTSE